jgi:hypothetical protein
MKAIIASTLSLLWIVLFSLPIKAHTLEEKSREKFFHMTPQGPITLREPRRDSRRPVGLSQAITWMV